MFGFWAFVVGGILGVPLSIYAAYINETCWSKEREAARIVVPAPADPNSQFEKDWIEARARRLQSGKVKPRRVS